jgi:hypothetical protein
MYTKMECKEPCGAMCCSACCSGKDHRVIWSGDLPKDERIPEGTHCLCGKKQIKYVRCKACKTVLTKFIPVKKK